MAATGWGDLAGASGWRGQRLVKSERKTARLDFFIFLYRVAPRHRLQLLTTSHCVSHECPGLPHRVTRQTGMCNTLHVSAAQQRDGASERLGRENHTIRAVIKDALTQIRGSHTVTAAVGLLVGNNGLLNGPDISLRQTEIERALWFPKLKNWIRSSLTHKRCCSVLHLVSSRHLSEIYSTFIHLSLVLFLFFNSWSPSQSVYCSLLKALFTTSIDSAFRTWQDFSGPRGRKDSCRDTFSLRRGFGSGHFSCFSLEATQWKQSLWTKYAMNLSNLL